jgi:tRNA(adenine34) deaminase
MPARMIATMNYELYMGAAIEEARAAMARGERPDAAVAVLDEAMVARGHDRVVATDDPTAHAVVVALREAARRVGSERLRDVTMFTTMEPCPMCIGALLAADAYGLVFAMPNSDEGAAGTRLQLADHPALRRRLKIVSGIRRDEVEDLYAASIT